MTNLIHVDEDVVKLDCLKKKIETMKELKINILNQLTESKYNLLYLNSTLISMAEAVDEIQKKGISDNSSSVPDKQTKGIDEETELSERT